MIGRIDNEFDHLTTNLKAALNTLKQILTFSSCFLLLGAMRYTWKFNSNIKFDNIYISRYFSIIDAKRRLQKKRTLLPMKQAEDMHYINPLGLKLTSNEKASMVISGVQLVAQILGIAIIMLLDWSLSAMMDIIATHSYTEYQIKGVHKLSVLVNGDGVVANVLLTLLRSFQQNKAVDVSSTNFECLPRAHIQSTNTNVYILVVYVILLVGTFIQAYILRIRRVIAGFYYPKREKQRIIYMYNDFMRRRLSFLKIQKRKIMLRAKENKVMGHVYKRFMDRVPGLSTFVCLIVGRRCIVCGQRNPNHVIPCPQEDCSITYCSFCWIDVGSFCFACGDSDSFVSGSDSDSDWNYTVA
uniref:E3 ubiquitin-protein ligase DCST1-like n=1 Tax=Myxine glutinosa TaxID=7769 RepID=UPI00358E1DA3